MALWAISVFAHESWLFGRFSIYACQIQQRGAKMLIFGNGDPLAYWLIVPLYAFINIVGAGINSWYLLLSRKLLEQRSSSSSSLYTVFSPASLGIMSRGTF